MLRKEDNPLLFEAIKNALSIRDNVLFFDEAILEKITYLHIDNIDTLKGIEKLKKLEYLEIVGKEDSTNIFEYKKIYQRNRDNKEFNMEDVFVYYYGEYTKNQIKEEDLNYIYKLPNLKHLNLSRQRNIKEIDLKHLSKLENIVMIECMNLRKINNIHKLEILNKNINNFSLDLAGCYRLKKIENIDYVLVQLHKKNMKKSYIYLPTIYFSKMNPKYFKIISKDNKYFNWSELCPGYRSDINDYNMLTAYNLAKDIVNDCCNIDDDKMEKVSNLYKWVCNNISYDYDGLMLNETSPLYETREKYNKVIRSSFTTLYYKKGVCVGVSGLFNYLCSLVDVVALPAYCSTKQIDFRRTVLGNHQISKIYLRNKAYYFDPTFDLDAIEFEFFAKNKSEISDTHFLAMGEYGEENGKSIQNILKVNGYTKNKNGKVKTEALRGKGYRR